MEILFVTHKYPPAIGGMEKQSFELITRISRKNTVHVLSYTGEGSKIKWFFDLKKNIKSILKKNPGIDLIHLNDGLMTAATLWLKKYTDIPVVATIHGLDITFPSHIYQKRIIPKMHLLDGIIAVSRATAKACVDRGFDEGRIHVVLNGVDHDLVTNPPFPNRDFLERKYHLNLENKKVVITMGRAVKRKGFSWFLNHVMPFLEDDIVFIMMGPLKSPAIGEKIIAALPRKWREKMQLMLGIPTDTKDILEALTNPLLSEKVYHLQRIPFDDLMQILSLGDLFVMPNIHVEGDAEGFGLVALEAGLRGTPVLAAGIEGITDAVKDGKNGWLVPSSDAEAWINAIHTILDDTQKLSAFSNESVKYILAHYDWDKMADEYLEVFDTVISKS